MQLEQSEIEDLTLEEILDDLPIESVKELLAYWNGNNDFPAGTSQSTFKVDNETKKTVSFYFLRKMDVAEAHG